MAYERALKVLCRLEYPIPVGEPAGRQGVGPRSSVLLLWCRRRAEAGCCVPAPLEPAVRTALSCRRPPRRGSGISESDYERWVDSLVGSRFEYVVAAQTYGRNARSGELRLRQLAQGVDTLVARWGGMCVCIGGKLLNERSVSRGT
jgi:hypothetical protein